MARTEARIFTSIWKDPQFAGIDQGSQWLYFFLLSQDDLTYSGVMPLRVRRWAPKATGLSVADLEASLKALEASPRRFIITDEESGELLVRSLLRRDGIWKQPNLLKLARESAEQLESPRLRAALLAELRRLPLDETPSQQVRTLVTDFIQDLEQGTPHPTDYPPGNPADDPADQGSGDPTAQDYAYARGNGVATGSTEVSPVPLFPGTPNPLPPESANQDRKNGTRMPDPFPVGAEMVAWVREKCPHVDGKRETERFEDHWRGKVGKDGRKLDWVATWRNWMRTAEDRQGPRDRPGRQQQTDDQFDRALQRAQSREGTLDAQ